MSSVLTLLVQIGLVLLASVLAGAAFRRLGQPKVIGEMLAGILLGPSFFGLLAPRAAAVVFPPGSLGGLHVLSQVGVVLFLFLVGLELDPQLLKRRGRAAIAISHASIAFPLLLGGALALYLHGRLYADAATMPVLPFALFLGTAMSITAFPVLARILTERGLHKTRIGALTITCAAVDDVTAWCLLAFVVAVVRSQGLSSALATFALAAVFVFAMWRIARPWLRRFELVYQRSGSLPQKDFAVLLALLIASAAATEAIGIHALFGGFLFGAILPKGHGFVRHLADKLEDLVVVFLLPLFFAYTGLGTKIGLIDSGPLWAMTALIVACACTGKIGGAAVAARLCGLSWRESGAIGVLMNTRGLMELVILDVGRGLGVIDDRMFAMMVIMAVVTTAMTTPALAWVYPERLHAPALPAGAAPVPERTPRERASTILLPFSRGAQAGALLELARQLGGSRDPARRLVALHVEKPQIHEAYRAAVAGDAPPRDPRKPVFDPLLAEARTHGLELEPLSITGEEVGDVINATATSLGSDLVLMRSHEPLLATSVLGGTVHRVLAHAPCDVAVFVGDELGSARRILVPYLGGAGGQHDQLALELARQLGEEAPREVTILHVVGPGRRPDERRLGVRAAVDDVFQEGAGSVRLRVVEHGSPVDAVIEAAREADLVIVGLSERFGLESQFFGWRRERIARAIEAPLLVVRRRRPAARATARPASDERPVRTA